MQNEVELFVLCILEEIPESYCLSNQLTAYLPMVVSPYGSFFCKGRGVSKYGNECWLAYTLYSI